MDKFAKEQQAISMLKAKKHQPWQIALTTNLSLTWIELQAQNLGLIPLTVMKAQVKVK
jgi:predicted regulator of Ras-like GTPase activity (Roadblock/LC7/MglB family)